jgi:hypothetical protein
MFCFFWVFAGFWAGFLGLRGCFYMVGYYGGGVRRIFRMLLSRVLDAF